jgi:malonyl-CoA reductase/3-hydroxypropionate dehydrogenase (NADP+)
MTKSVAPREIVGAVPQGRLAGKITLVTGAAGNLGGYIVRSYLKEGAIVVMTGRERERIEAAARAAVADTGVGEDRVVPIVLDGADSASVRAGIATVVARFGRIDVLVNNAGSAGPKQPLEALPFDVEDLDALRAAGSSDSENLSAAVRNIFGVAWNLVRAAAPAIPEGGSIVNVSTIFSRTPYYGRTAYVTPKAAMNAWSRELSLQLGPRGVRVNLVFPGPIASERIRTVFAAMDGLRGDEAGTTQSEIFDMMSLVRSIDEAERAKTFPTADDVAATCVFLASDDSAAFNGHDFEVTHGMTVRKEARSTFLARPTMRSIDGAGLNVLIAGGADWEEAIEIAGIQMACGAKVLLGLSRQADVAIAQARAKAEKMGEQLAIVRLNRAEPKAMEAALDAYTDLHGPLTGAIIMPFLRPDELSKPLVEASEEDVVSFMDLELAGAVALARTLSRYWKRQTALLQAPRFVFLSNGTDGQGDVYASLARRSGDRRRPWASGPRRMGQSDRSLFKCRGRKHPVFGRSRGPDRSEGEQDPRRDPLCPPEHQRSDGGAAVDAGLQREHHGPAPWQGRPDYRRIGRDRRSDCAPAGAGRRQGDDGRAARGRAGARAVEDRQRT